MTKDELAAKYPSLEWRTKFLVISQLVDFLQESILKADYKVPDQLNEAITLSNFGKRVHQDLVTKHDVPPKEARVLCLLTLAHTEPLVDVENFKVEALEEAINRQVLNGSLLFPFRYGRELYDRAADLFEDERRHLNHQDTLKLLEGTPIGVFQLGQLVMGPYGIVHSETERYLGPTRQIPLYHCSEITCESVHRCTLSTDNNASVNQHYAKLYKILEKISPDASAWGAFMTDVAGMEGKAFDDLSTSTLPFVIGDCLTDQEMRHLMCRLMDNTVGRFRQHLKGLGIEGKAADAVIDLGRAEMMQLILLNEDRVIVEALDHLVLAGAISIPKGEIRKPVVNRSASSGRFGLQVQLGEYGCRVHSRNADIGPLRLKRLVDGLYLLDEESDVSELEWQLREVDAPTLSSRLDEYVRTFTPRQVVRRLVLARRTNMISACTSLGIDEHREWADDDLIDALLWKLDFMPADDRDESRRFWQLHERMKQVTQTAGVSALVDQEAVRGLASNYFVEVERFLGDSLSFCVWALITDHLSAPKPFAYRAEDEGEKSFAALARYESLRDSGPERIDFTAQASLYELCRGFGTLAGLLQQCLADEKDHLRPEVEFPRFVKFSDLKQFPFRHRIPFLDLLSSSQQRILEVLTAVAKTLVAADVSGVRNDQLHFRRSTTDLGRLSDCLNGVEQSARLLEQSGLTRLLFRPLSQQGDEWGRRIYTLVDPRGREISIARPSSYDWLLLPGLQARQYLMTSAVFTEPNEILRFREDISSPYSEMWNGFPRRRQLGSVTSHAGSPVDETSMQPVDAAS